MKHSSMSPINFTSKPQVNDRAGHRLRAFLVSCLFHGLLLGLLVGVTFIYRTHLRPTDQGSPFSSRSLPTLVIVAPPLEIPPPPVPAKPLPPSSSAPVVQSRQPSSHRASLSRKPKPPLSESKRTCIGHSTNPAAGSCSISIPRLHTSRRFASCDFTGQDRESQSQTGGIGAARQLCARAF